MEYPFTRFLEQLEEGEPDTSDFEKLWQALERALRVKLRQQGLWLSPPSYLGVIGSDRWQGGALEELVADCYSFIFISRLGSLQAQRRIKPNVDGLVRINIRHFLYERQKKHGALGYRLFSLVQKAILDLLERDEIHLLSGDSRVRNDSVLGFGPQTSPRRAVARELLEEHVDIWNHELLPDLITARARASQDRVIQRLSDLISELASRQIEAFCFRDLVTILRNDTMKRWGALLETTRIGGSFREEESEAASRPHFAWEETESFEDLADCVSAALEGRETDDITRRYLAAVWEVLRIAALGGEPMPSRRQIAKTMRVPRDRMPVLFAILGEMVNDCRGTGRKP